MLLGLYAYWSVRLAWADHLSLSSKLADRERAIRLAPAIAALAERVADKQEDLESESLAGLERAVSLDPENSRLRMRLGLRAELTGNFALAEEALLAAASRSRLYQPRYLLAQFYFRRQSTDNFWKWSRSALEIAYGDVTALLDLGWRMQPDSDWIWQHAIPARREIIRQYLVFLGGKRQWDTARTVALSLLTPATAADRPILLDYIERRLTAGNGTDALAVWNALCRRGLLPYQPLDPMRDLSLTGADFGGAPLEVGFDWRLNNPSGVTLARGNHEIRLRFSGSEREQSMILWQYVPVEPAREYRLKFGLRSIDAATVDGIGWSIAESTGIELAQALAPSAALQFHSTQNSVLKLALIYRRPLGSTRLEGAVALTAPSLERIR